MTAITLRQSPLLWGGYIMLILFSCSLLFSSLSFLAVAVLLLGYILRMYFRKRGEKLQAEHCTWLVNSIWLALLLGLAALVGVLVVGYWMSSDPQISARINELLDSSLEPMALLNEMFRIPGTKTMMAIILVVSWLIMVWPLKRALHGLFALNEGLTPAQLGSRRWVALVLAVAVQICLPVSMFGM